MNKNDIEVGKFYVVEISGNLSVVEITYPCATGGWWGIIIKTDSQVILSSADRFQREATAAEVKSKKVGTRLIKFEIPDGPRVKGFDEIIKKLMAGATLPDEEPLPEATATILDRIARGEPDIQVGPQYGIIAGMANSEAPPPRPKEEWDGRVEVGKPNPLSFRELAKVILNLTYGQDAYDIAEYTGLPFVHCKEIIKIRDKLLDILE